MPRSDTLGELSLTDSPERYAKLAFPELERQAARHTSVATKEEETDAHATHRIRWQPAAEVQGVSVGAADPHHRTSCGVLFKLDSIGRPVQASFFFSFLLLDARNVTDNDSNGCGMGGQETSVAMTVSD